MNSSDAPRIIIVDDEKSIIDGLTRILRAGGYEMEGHTSPGKALERMKAVKFDILLTDLLMPGMSGIELIAAALAIDPTMACIVMTGHATVDTAIKAMKSGAFDYVSKPFDPEAILLTTGRALEMTRLRRDNMSLQETVSLHELSKAMTYSLDSQAIAERLADAATRQCNAHEASVMLLLDKGGEFEIAAVRGERDEKILGLKVPVERGIAGWVARTLEPLLLHGVAVDPRYATLKPRDDITSSISMPMVAGGKLTGVLNVATKGSRVFVPGQVKALGILGGIAAQALDNAQLYGQLQESERRYRTIVETLQEGLWVIDGYGTTTFVNRKMAEILGYTVEEMPGKRMYHFVVNDLVRAFTLFLEECQKGSREQQEFVFMKKDGSRIHTEMVTASLKDEQGRHRGVVASIVDVSEKKRLRE